MLNSTEIMNRGIIIGVAIAIIIGIGALVVSQSNSDNNSEISIIENVEDKTKQFTIGLEESVGFSENP